MLETKFGEANNKPGANPAGIDEVNQNSTKSK
jgi:hypothetical protein